MCERLYFYILSQKDFDMLIQSVSYFGTEFRNQIHARILSPLDVFSKNPDVLPTVT